MLHKSLYVPVYASNTAVKRDYENCCPHGLLFINKALKCGEVCMLMTIFLESRALSKFTHESTARAKIILWCHSSTPSAMHASSKHGFMSVFMRSVSLTYQPLAAYLFSFLKRVRLLHNVWWCRWGMWWLQWAKTPKIWCLSPKAVRPFLCR